jgi:hypothetical protein
MKKTLHTFKYSEIEVKTRHRFAPCQTFHKDKKKEQSRKACRYANY